ncbi:hypothetical protein HDU98_002930 [Podochytrium sp. JEL0797]|nr:hypothetical protein HDU98_002930 [Podochytrium sp. JEL0797]
MPAASPRFAFVHEPRVASQVEVAPHSSLYFELHGLETAPKKLLLIPGIGETCRMWGLAIESLKSDPDIEVCVFDLPGAGDSTWKHEFTMEDLADNILLLLSYIGWQKDVWVVGHAMGGMIAQHLVLTASAGRFRGIALINSSAKDCQSTTAYFAQVQFGLAKKTLENSVKTSTKMGFPANWLKQSPTWTTEFATNQEFIVKYSMERSADKPRQTPEGRKAQKLAASTHRLTSADLREVGNKSRVFVLCGKQDKVVSPSNSQQLAALTGGKLINFTGCGHALFEQEFEKFHDVLVNEVLA